MYCEVAARALPQRCRSVTVHCVTETHSLHLEYPGLHSGRISIASMALYRSRAESPNHPRSKRLQLSLVFILFRHDIGMQGLNGDGSN